MNKNQVNSWDESWFNDLDIVMLPEAPQITGIRPDRFLPLVKQIIKKHLVILETKTGKILKDSYETAVTIVDTAQGATFCVKQFNDRGPLHRLKGVLRKPHGARTFYNGAHLISNGVLVATPLALVTKKFRGLVSVEWIIMQFMENFIEMDRYLLKKFEDRWSKEQQKSAVRQFGRFVGSMHSKGIFHSDLKTCNIMVSEGVGRENAIPDKQFVGSHTEAVSLRFCLLDYDDVKFSSHIPMRKRVKNLVQIFLSTPSLINRVERMRFLDEYSMHAGLSGRDRKRLAQEVIRKSQGRQILYVGFNGDVVETLDLQLPK